MKTVPPLAALLMLGLVVPAAATPFDSVVSRLGSPQSTVDASSHPDAIRYDRCQGQTAGTAHQSCGTPTGWPCRRPALIATG